MRATVVAGLERSADASTSAGIVLTDAGGLGLRTERAVARCDDANVDLVDLLGADRLDLALLLC